MATGKSRKSPQRKSTKKSQMKKSPKRVRKSPKRVRRSPKKKSSVPLTRLSSLSDVDDRSSRTIGAEMIKKESRKTKFKRLQDYSWGIGLEHEMQFLHRPKLRVSKFGSHYIKDSTIFATKGFMEELIGSDELTTYEKEFVEKVPFETTGRKCHGKWALKKIPILMPEFVTEDPFSNLKTGKRPVESYCDELRDKEDEFDEILHKNPKVVRLEDIYGDLNQYPFGVSNYLKYPIKYVYPYKFPKDGKMDKVYTDYLGSYHITLTLPFKKTTPEKAFMKAHQNFANQMQWIEPLLITAFFSSDQKAVGTKQKRIKGSFRIVRVAWGNLAGSDVRKFNKGIGRYSDIEPYWRNDLEYYNKDKTEYCERLAPQIRSQEPGAQSGYSSDFRTFGSTDPDRPWHRESGAPMTKPNGVEFRIFDHFDSIYIYELCKLVVYLAENSRVHTAKKYVYQNPAWIKATQNIMMNGWNATIPKEYVDELRQQLGLKIKTKSLVAYNVLQEVNQELFQKNKKGDWTYLMLKEEYNEPPFLPQINRRSWEMGLMMKMNRNPNLLVKYNKMIDSLPAKLTVNSFKTHFFKYFDKENWSRDVKDMIYFLQTRGIFRIYHNEDGSIETIETNKKNIRKVAGFDNEIVAEWNRPKFVEIAKAILKRRGEVNKSFNLDDAYNLMATI